MKALMMSVLVMLFVQGSFAQRQDAKPLPLPPAMSPEELKQLNGCYLVDGSWSDGPRPAPTFLQKCKKWLFGNRLSAYSESDKRELMFQLSKTRSKIANLDPELNRELMKFMERNQPSRIQQATLETEGRD